MNAQFTLQVWIMLMLSCLLMSCNRDEVQAEKSLTGEWNITAITSIYGEFSPTSFDPSSTLSETGSWAPLPLQTMSQISISHEMTPSSQEVADGVSNWKK